jgi:putative hemolysin
LLLFVANGVFAMIETAVIGSRKSRLKEMAARWREGAASALRLAENPNYFLPTVQTGITLVGLLAGAFSGATLAGHLAQAIRAVPAPANYADAAAVGAVVVALTFASIVIGELVPKRIALPAPERIVSRLAPPIEWMSRASPPAVKLLAAVTDLPLRLFCVKVTRYVPGLGGGSPRAVV